MFFADYSAGYKGNFIFALEKVSEKITKEGGSVVWLLPKKAEMTEWVRDEDNVFFLKEKGFSDFLLLCRLIRQFKINIIHSHFLSLKYDIPLKFARILNPKVHYIRHMHMIYREKSLKAAEYIKRFFSNGQSEIACSKYAAEAMKAAGFKNVYEVENAIDFVRLENFGEDYFADNKKHILMFGYSYVGKGVDIAIRAAKQLKRDDFELDICTAAYLQEVTDAIKAEFGEIPAFVRLLPSRSDIGTYYCSSKVFLSPSPAESFCFAVREAAFCGCRIVASNIDAHKIDCDELLFEVGNDRELAAMLASALDASGQPLQLRTKLQKRYDVEEMCDKILKIYKEKAI